MIQDYTYRLFTFRQAKSLLRSLFEPEMVKQIVHIIRFKQENLIDQRVMNYKFPKMNSFEEEFLKTTEDMCDEVEQLLFLSSPILHESLEAQIREDIRDIREQYSASEVREDLNQIRFIPEVDELLLDKDMFQEYHDFILHLLNSYDLTTWIFTKPNTEESLLQTLRDKQRSSLIDPTIKEMIRDDVKFDKVCKRFLSPVEYKGKKHLMMYKDKDGNYLWKGTQKRGIPALASLLYHLILKDVIIVDYNFALTGRTFLNFFGMKIDKHSVDFFRKNIKEPYHNLPLIEEALEDILP